MSPQAHAAAAESNPKLPAGTEERVAGYGVMGVPYASGHVLGLRRWTASSVGEPFTSIWHRRPDGTWRFLESMVSEKSCDIACSRWFGAGTTGSEKAEIDIAWDSPTDLRVSTRDGSLDWRLSLSTTPAMRLMNVMGAAMPMRAWKSEPILKAMGAMATRMLGQGQLELVGTTPNGQNFIANPHHIWQVDGSTAIIDGADAGPIAALPQQAKLGDFWIPQRGIFAMGRVYMWR